MFQTFLSLVLMLGGRVGRDVKHGYVVADVTASACEGSTRLNFVRSDLLLWTQSVSDYASVRDCDGFTILHTFVQRASRDADVVLLGVGHHFPRSLMLAEKWSKLEPADAAKRARVSFFVRNLNHTLHSLVAARAAWGRTDPSTVVVLGTSTPVRGCAGFAAPLDTDGALRAAAAAGDVPSNAADVTSNELRWLMYARQDSHARTLARGVGASYLSVARPSAMRPDGAMGRYWPATSQRRLDCVHYCLPGVVDTWATLLVNLLGSSRLQHALGVAEASAANVSAAEPPSVPTADAPLCPRRFLEANLSAWLRERGFAERLEGCARRDRPRAAPRAGPRAATIRSVCEAPLCEPLLRTQHWWPFHCWAGRERTIHKGADHQTRYQPWMPPESFD